MSIGFSVSLALAKKEKRNVMVERRVFQFPIRDVPREIERFLVHGVRKFLRAVVTRYDAVFMSTRCREHSRDAFVYDASYESIFTA